MARFLVLYNSKMSAAEVMANATPEETKAGMDAWMAWAQQAGDAVVDLGVPLGESTHLENGSASAGSNEASGYSIVEAGSLDAAAKLLEAHPHLHVPGNSIDVLEFLAMPGTEAG
jgi:hypothetical protein